MDVDGMWMEMEYGPGWNVDLDGMWMVDRDGMWMENWLCR